MAVIPLIRIKPLKSHSLPEPGKCQFHFSVASFAIDLYNIFIGILSGNRYGLNTKASAD